MNKDEYYKQFEGDISPDKTKFEKALELSIDIRKFEIELYWKRATYFWTFIAATFAGYALVYTKGGNDKEIILLLFSCLGLLFSFAWFLVNKGSKYWQNNWERHVDLLEDKVIGSLYKTIAETPNRLHEWFICSSPYSVSKINQLLSLFVCVFWIVLVFDSTGIKFIFTGTPNWLKTILVGLTIVAIACLWIFSKSDHKTKIKLMKREIDTL